MSDLLVAAIGIGSMFCLILVVTGYAAGIGLALGWLEVEHYEKRRRCGARC